MTEAKGAGFSNDLCTCGHERRWHAGTLSGDRVVSGTCMTTASDCTCAQFEPGWTRWVPAVVAGLGLSPGPAPPELAGTEAEKAESPNDVCACRHERKWHRGTSFVGSVPPGFCVAPASCNCARFETVWTQSGASVTAAAGWQPPGDRADRWDQHNRDTFMADLDRCRHGRHPGDACFGCPGQVSVGNPLWAVGTPPQIAALTDGTHVPVVAYALDGNLWCLVPRDREIAGSRAVIWLPAARLVDEP